MVDWVERYVYDVVRRLPENDRADVEQELKSNIYDMLPENAGEEETKAVLTGLGPPAQMAEQYRQKPRYLISPAVYDDYVRVLKWVLPMVGGILLVIGLLMGVVENLDSGMTPLPDFIAAVLTNGISMGVSGALQALLWTTVGFVIVDRTGAKSVPSSKNWNVNDLPEVKPYEKDKSRIPLADSIVELVVIVVFSAIGIALCAGAVPIVFFHRGSGTEIVHFFSDSFLALCVPFIAIGCLLGVVECVVKIVKCRWTPLVCGTVIAGNVAGVGLMLYLFTRQNILSPEFSAYVQSQNWGSLDAMRFLGNPVANPILVVIAAIVIIATVAECASALYKTLRAR